VDYRKGQRLWDDPSTAVHAEVTPGAFASFADQIVQIAQPTATDRVLDVGCGDGQLSAVMRRYVATLNGFDFAESRVANASRAVPSGEFTAQSFLEPFTGGPYDLIYSFSVLQYCKVSDIDRLLQHCVDALAPGGRIVHGDVIDRSKLRYLYLSPASGRSIALYGRALLLPRRPIWRDGSTAHEVRSIVDRWRQRGIHAEALPAECRYRSHLLLRP
jgi:SAM-dependent methyltransferase